MGGPYISARQRNDGTASRLYRHFPASGSAKDYCRMSWEAPEGLFDRQNSSLSERGVAHFCALDQGHEGQVHTCQCSAAHYHPWWGGTFNPDAHAADS